MSFLCETQGIIINGVRHVHGSRRVSGCLDECRKIWECEKMEFFAFPEVIFLVLERKWQNFGEMACPEYCKIITLIEACG